MTRLVWMPAADPAVTDGPRCGECPHLWRSKDTPGLVSCVAFDETLRSDARRRVLRGESCRRLESLVGTMEGAA